MLGRCATMILSAAFLSAVACSGGGDRDTRRSDERSDAGPVETPPTPAAAPSAAAAEDETLADGDIRIVTTNGGIDLALIGDTVSSGLSPQALREVRRETDTAAVHGTGIGADIEKMVKGTVQGAVRKRASFPLSEVRSARYDGERLVFEWEGSPRKLFDNTKIDGKPLLASFAPDDARRFAAAVNARKGRPRHL
jgi:hypothetical protein